ncbi:hypothetical protein, partial [Tardiphaga sp.]|uniref:hypothetical protein n=1 Tax=Tardiphaga sp. TaxID=1926292 RepID=UPI0026158D49
MKRFQVVGMVCLVAAVGCDVPVEPEVALAPTTAALENAAHVAERLDESTQSIVFDPGVNTAWADLHLTINGTRGTNVRMRKGADGTFVAGPFALRADDELTYSFTYFARGVGNDTATYTRIVPLTFEPRALRPEVRAAFTPGAYQMRLVSTAKVTWADVHYAVNGAPALNARLVDAGGTLARAITLAP